MSEPASGCGHNHQHLAAEIAALRTSAESLLFTPLERTFAIAAVVVGVGVTVGVAQDRAAVLLALPATMAILFGFLLQMNVEMLNRMGHKRYLEEVANGCLGHPVFLEELYVAPSRQGPWRFGRVGLVLLQLQLLLIMAGLTVLGYSVVFDFPTWVQWLYTISICMGIAGLASGVRELTRAYPRGYHFAKLSRDGGPPESPTGVSVPH